MILKPKKPKNAYPVLKNETLKKNLKFSKKKIHLKLLKEL
jgi:hypothetical protein